LRITVGKATATDCLNCQSPLEWQFAMHRARTRWFEWLRRPIQARCHRGLLLIAFTRRYGLPGQWWFVHGPD
jgi:hypothetical protein